MRRFAYFTTGSAIKTFSNVLKGRNKYSLEYTFKKCNKIRWLSLMVYYRYEDEKVKVKTIPKKVYVIINGEKHYIDPEIVKRYNLEKQEVSFFSGRKIYVEKN